MAVASKHCSPLVEFMFVKVSTVLSAAGVSRPLLLAQFTFHRVQTLRTRFVNCIAPSVNNKQITPTAFFIIAGDFNHANLKTVLPKFYQHVNFCNKGKQHTGHCLHNRKERLQSCTPPPTSVLRPHLCYANPSI